MTPTWTTGTRPDDPHEPYFPDDVRGGIEDCLDVVSIEDSDVLDRLWQATARFVDARAAQAHGCPHLSGAQGEQLQRISTAATALIAACGGRDVDGVRDTQDLVGGWAHGLLHGLSLEELVQAVAALQHEVDSELLARGQPRQSHRPVDSVRQHFIDEVALALQATGAPTLTTAAGGFARVVQLLLAATGEGPVSPRSLEPSLRAATTRRPR